MLAALENLSASDWTSLAYKSIVAGMPLQDVHVVTTRCDYVNLVFEAAAQAIVEYDGVPTMEAIARMAELAVNSIDLYTTERVRISERGIEVFINVSDIDDTCIPVVCQMVTHTLSVLNGHYGEIDFSEPMQFDIHDELHPRLH